MKGLKKELKIWKASHQATVDELDECRKMLNQVIDDNYWLIKNLVHYKDNQSRVQSMSSDKLAKILNRFSGLFKW